MIIRPTPLLILSSSLLLTACALEEKLDQANFEYQSAQTEINNQHDAFTRSLTNKEQRIADQDVNKPWVVGKSLPLARELTLPVPLQNRVNTTLLFTDGSTDLRKIARRIASVTNIPVYVRPDALLPASNFLPKLQGETNLANNYPEDDFEPLNMSKGPEPLAHILDRVSSYLGVLWRFENNRIEFYRTQTRVFNVHALSLAAKSEMSLGLGKGQNDAGFVSSANTSFNTGEFDVMQAIKARLEPFLSKSGVLVAQSGAGAAVVVTDTPEVLDNIGRYLEAENRSLTRRVRLVFEELTVAIDEKDLASIDWNLIFAGASVVTSLAAPGLAQESASKLGISVINGKMSGSDAVINALGDSVKLLRRNSIPMMTLNRRPVTHAVRKTFSYIDKIETTPISGSNGLSVPAVSVNQKEETVGSLLTLVPDVQDDGRILLSLAYDNTVAQPLKTIAFGDKSNPLQLQQLTVEGNGTVQQFALQAGQPLVISGFDRQLSESSKRRLVTGIPAIFGGGDQLNQQSITTILVITAQIEEGL